MEISNWLEVDDEFWRTLHDAGCAFFVHFMTQFLLRWGRKAAGKGGKGGEKC